MKKKIAYLIKHVPAIQYMYVHVMSYVFKLLGCFLKIDEKLILFSSYGGTRFSDSPKVLYEAIQQDMRFLGYRCVWAFEQPENFIASGLDVVKIDTLSYFITALKAKVWITNVNMERGLHFKQKETIYLNTWHGTGPKKGGNAVEGRSDYDFSCVDILCIDGTYMEYVMQKYFNAKKESFVWCGRPREDALFQYTNKEIESIRHKLNLPSNKKIILYMPTWRDGTEVRKLNCNLWQKALSDYVILIRQHHFSEAHTGKNNDIFLDVSDYPDVNDLYLVSDILISDYSSAFFDFALLKKPIICYAYDYDEYERSYGLFIDLKKEFPNGVIKSESALIEFISSMDYANQCRVSADFCNKYVQRSGNATEICLNKLYGLLRNK